MVIHLSSEENDHGTRHEYATSVVKPVRVPWTKGKLLGAKPTLQTNRLRSIREKLQIEGKKRNVAVFNLAIDSKLRGCDVVAVRVDDVAPSGYSMDLAANVCFRRCRNEPLMHAYRPNPTFGGSAHDGSYWPAAPGKNSCGLTPHSH